MHGFLATSAVFAPALAGLLALWLARGPRAASVVAVLASCVSILALVALTAAGGEHTAVIWRWAPGFLLELSFRIDALTRAMGLLVSVTSALVLAYAGAYFDGRKGAVVIGGMALFEAAMLGVALSDNLLALYVFWELTTVCSFFLILSDADERDDAFEPAQQALLVTMAGGLTMFVGFLVLSIAGGTASLTALEEAGLEQGARTAALALVLAGALTKSAQVPFQSWLPGAMVAPTPVSALLHSATMVKAGVILLIYVQPLFADMPLWSALVPIGAVTCVWGSYRALCERDIKRLLAWSTVSQLGLIVLTLGLGSALALRAALLHIFAHAAFKGGLFLVAGAVDHAAHTRELDGLGGLWRRMPVLAATTIVLGASMAGLPPMAGYLSKELIVKEGLHAAGWVELVALAGIVVGSVGTVAYTARLVFGVFFGARDDDAQETDRPEPGLVLPAALLAVVTVVAGFLTAPVDRGLLEPVTAAAVGHPPGAEELALWHGLEPPFLVSVGIVAGGLLLWVALRRRFLDPAPLLRRALQPFEALLEGSQAVGRWIDGLAAGLRPTWYYGVAVLVALVPALSLVPESLGAAAGPWDGRVVVLVGLQAVLLAALLAARDPLTLVLLVTAVGLTVALLFRAMHAPDLALTQLLVDLVTSVLLVLAIRLVRATQEVRAPSWAPRAGAAAVGATCGLALFAIVRVVLSHPAPDTVRAYYVEAGPGIAAGENLVNVILTDFRALDTLGETLVVAIAAMGVFSVLRGRELPGIPTEPT